MSPSRHDSYKTFWLAVMLVGIGAVQVAAILSGGFVDDDGVRAWTWLGTGLLAGWGLLGWGAGLVRVQWDGLAARCLALLALMAAIAAVQLVPLPRGLATLLSPSLRGAAADAQTLAVGDGWLPLSAAPEKTAEALAQVVASACLFAAASFAVTRYRGYLWLRRIVLGATFLMATLGLLRFGLGGGSRATGTLGNPNHFAAFVALGLPLAISTAWRMRPSRASSARPDTFMIVAALAIVAMLAWMLSLSRGSLLAAFPIMAFWLLWEWRRRARRGGRSLADTPVQFRFEAALLVVALIALVSFAAVPSAITARIDPTGPSGSMRLNLWKAGLKTFVESPLLGTGLGAAEFGLNRHLADLPMRRVAVEVHNDWIQWLAELGLAGALGTVLLTWRLLRTPDLHVATGSGGALSPSTERRAVAVGMAVVMVHSLVDFPLRVPGVGFQFLLMGALLAAPLEVRSSVRRRRTRREDAE